MKRTYTELGFCRLGAGAPPTRTAATDTNAAALAAMALQASHEGADIFVFPELCVTGASCGSLFAQETLLEGAEQALRKFLTATGACDTLFILGAPLRRDGLLFNCAVVCWRGVVLGVVPQNHPDSQWAPFAPWTECEKSQISLCGTAVPFGADLLFESRAQAGCVVGVEFGSDMLSPLPPGQKLAAAGATLLALPSAHGLRAAGAQQWRTAVLQHARRCHAACLCANAGPGESSAEIVRSGQLLLVEAGALLAEGASLPQGAASVLADVDLGCLLHERRSSRSFVSAAQAAVGSTRRIHFGEARDPMSARHVNCQPELQRRMDPHPFVPAQEAARQERCAEIFAIQSAALATRLTNTGFNKVVLGVSGGLDSALALLATCAAFERAALDRGGILAITMPGFGTTQGSLEKARRLCAGLGVAFEEIDITAVCRQHLADIGHDGARHDAAYENAQARERTQILMDKANMLGALVIGTGDLSELALGWCTFNGDQMSMYSVNCGVPKTLVQHLIQWGAQQPEYAAAAEVLQEILAVPISPELLPPDAKGALVQKTEEVIGPYELHDFFLYHFLRRGAGRRKIQLLAETAFKERYTGPEVERWLRLFFKRFFSQQFKRASLPEGPRVGSVGLSPRTQWHMPGDMAFEEELGARE